MALPDLTKAFNGRSHSNKMGGLSQSEQQDLKKNGGLKGLFPLKGKTPLVDLATRGRSTNPLIGRRHVVGGAGPSNKEMAPSSPNMQLQAGVGALNRRYFIVGERRISSYWWASVFFLGGFGFLITGISSYLKYNLFSSFYRIIENAPLGLQNFTPTLPLMEGTGGESLVFFPQGLLMCFYGSLGLLLSLYWWLLIYWNVGGGFNEFNKKEGFMRIFRWGYPGKNRRIDLVYSLKDIEAIRVELKQSQGLLASSDEQTIFVRLLLTPSNGTPEATQKKPSSVGLSSSEGGNSFGKEKREIPLGGIGQPLTLKEIEKQASELANYLQVALEGL